ncbi:hypothetical protein GCM10009839_00170 [Catenulispora yoronensis]|uniref:Sec-independent protein translocase protein TatA n=1 Tax=Catenulispora yoronensis TaxID=450799 RepID=A0ABN2TI98_9ACTN
MTGAFEPWHILLIVGIAVVLFGAKRLPVAARSMGQSLRIFRSELRQAVHDGEPPPPTLPSPTLPPSTLPPVQDPRREHQDISDIADRRPV